MQETQYSITLWANSTFGRADTNLGTALRAEKELKELLFKLHDNDKHPEALEEVADIIIVLQRLATDLGGDLNLAINTKMQKNRAREWILDGKGHGQHK